MSEKQLIGSTEAAALLGLARSSVNRYVTEGRITPIGELGKRGIYVFDKSEIEALALELRGGSDATS